ncbi:hypothetical protein ACX1C1_15085 [Paenibacillus sp. strain BS8-2]
MTDHNQFNNSNNNQHQDPHTTQQNDPYREQAFTDPFAPGSANDMDRPPLKHSGIGIAAFVISLVALLMIVIGIVVISVSIGNLGNDDSLIQEIERISTSYGEGQEAEMGAELMESDEFGSAIATFMIAGILLLGSLAVAFVGLILGIIGVASRERRKTFGIIGLVINGLILLGTVGLVVISISIGAMGAV